MAHFSGYNYNAPAYHDFNSIHDDSEVDKYFDTDHEQSTNTIPTGVVKQEVLTPEPKAAAESSAKLHFLGNNIKSEENTPLNQSMTPRSIRKAFRRLSEINPIALTTSNNMEDVLNQAMENLLVKKENKRKTIFEGITLFLDTEKNHNMTTRQDKHIKTPTFDLRSRTVVKSDVVTEYRKRRGSPTLINSQSKYMGMAERVMHFERDTPPRFHSRRRSDMFQKYKTSKLRRTIALTPNLTTIHRSRPVNIQSQEDKEKIEIEEMKKHQVKALPLNKEILNEPTVLPKIDLRPITKPFPFNLTKVVKKPIVEQKPFQFTARPVPKTVREPTIHPRPLRERIIKVPVLEPKDSSYIVKPKEISHQGLQTHKIVKQSTEPEPFSFEKRDQEMLKKKELKIQEYLEKERKAREFHANPLPVYAKPIKKEVSTILPTVPAPPKFKTEERIQKRQEKDSQKFEEDSKPFKARPATVLHKSPFEPIKPERQLDIVEFELNTERRAREREEFDLKVKEQEQLFTSLKREHELKLKQKQEEEISKLRKEMVHKAVPVPSFKTPVIKQSDKPLTEPQSPCFTKRSKRFHK